MSISAFGIDHGISKALAQKRPSDPTTAGVLGGAAGAGVFASGGARRAVKGVNEKVRSERAAGRPVTRTMAGAARVGGGTGGALGRIVGRPGKTAAVAGGFGLAAAGAASLRNRSLQRKQPSG